MAQPIYQVFLARSSEAWYQLSPDEQRNLLARVGEALEKVGGKRVVYCNSGWCSEQWRFWGVEQFPDIEAVQKHATLLEGLNWFRYVESMTVLGTELPASSG